GAIVQSYMIAGSNISGRTDSTTVADMDGRYRLTGMPKGLGNQVRALPPDGQPYLMSVKSAANTPGLEPVTVDFTLKRGLWINGRVIDKATGKPVRAQIEYFLLPDNPHIKEAPGLSTNRLENRDDGTFRLIGLPGRSLVVARAWGDRHLVGVGAENIKGRLQYGFLDTQPGLAHPTHYHTLVELNPD